MLSESSRGAGSDVSRRAFVEGAVVAAGAAGVARAALASEAADGKASSSAAEGAAAASSAKAGAHSWDAAPAPITDVAQTKEYDVVVVGGGMAGMGAAQAAARFGASVAVVERNEEGRFCGLDMAAMGSKVLSDVGIDIDPEFAARLMFSASQQEANYNLIHTWATQTAPVIDYITELCAENGVTVEPSVGGTSKAGWTDMPEKYVVLQDAVRFSNDEWGVFDRPDGKEPHQNLGDVLIKSATDNGCEFFFNTHAEQLVGSAAEGVTGVIATAADGSHIQFNARKGVVLATGDISGNQEMVDCWAPIINRADESAYVPKGANTGDAILMGKWIGAGISKSAPAPMVHQFTIATRAYNMTAFFVTMLAVNSDGRRFMNEMPFEPYITDARMNSKGNVAWSIFDSDYPTYVQKQFPDAYEDMLTTIPDELDKRIADGEVFKADTLEELAGMIGVPAENLVATAESFNQMYEQGQDTQFGVAERMLSQVKTAPFYAVPIHASTLAVCYGLHVNDDSQVCTDDDQPIAGLFAAGNCQGDFFAFNYPVHCPGCSTGRSLVFGQLIGEALAKDEMITELIASR
ncbi:MAG: FAD-binding protein [Coriobacteriales bacterium]|jgi:fumarate reductase flavoprotein subunit